MNNEIFSLIYTKEALNGFLSKKENIELIEKIVRYWKYSLEERKIFCYNEEIKKLLLELKASRDREMLRENYSVMEVTTLNLFIEVLENIWNRSK